MRVMLDTNVLVSLLLFPREKMNTMMGYIFREHELVLSSFVVDELKAVVHKKFPAKEKAIDNLLTKMSYDFVYTPEEMDYSLFCIRDKKDYPVLYTAIIEGVDVLITGDKDFGSIEIEKPDVVTPARFMEKYLYR
jgi:putative PIN family toxin of toxin-antitoxin system